MLSVKMAFGRCFFLSVAVSSATHFYSFSIMCRRMEHYDIFVLFCEGERFWNYFELVNVITFTHEAIALREKLIKLQVGSFFFFFQSEHRFSWPCLLIHMQIQLAISAAAKAHLGPS